MTESQVMVGDCRALLSALEANSAQCCVTSPPYWQQRDYEVDGQIGLEATPDEYVAVLVDVFRRVHRVLREDGTLWLNLGDTYAAGGRGGGGSYAGERRSWEALASRKGWRSQPPGLKRKDLVGIPWRVALALQADGWWLRSDIVWHKPNPVPESVTDRPTRAHEYLFLLTKSERYFYDVDSVRTPQKTLGERHEGRSGYREGHPSKGGMNHRELHPLGANLRSVWTLPAQPFDDAHFAVMPPALIDPCILAGSRAGDLVLDPFSGAGTVGLVARRRLRRFIGMELKEDYARLSVARINSDAPLFERTELVLERATA